MRPRPLMSETWGEMEFKFNENIKEWMKRELFFGLLGRFESFIGLTPGRKKLPLVKSCSALGKTEELPHLNIVNAELLQTDMASRIQPLDDGVIDWVKDKYKRLLFFPLSDKKDLGNKSISNVYILKAIRRN